MLIAGIDTLKHYLPNTCQISEETTKKIVRIYSGAMTHRAKILAVSGTLGLGVAYKIGILTAMPTLIGLAVIPIFYKLYQNYITKNTVEPLDRVRDEREIRAEGQRIFYRPNFIDQHWNSSALLWIEQNKEHINIPLQRNCRAIHNAIIFDFDISVINSLIAAGADLNIRSTDNIFPLDCAIGRYIDCYMPEFSGLDPVNRLKILKIVIKAGARITTANSWYLNRIQDQELQDLLNP